MLQTNSIYRTALAFILVLAGMMSWIPQGVNCHASQGEFLVPKDLRFSLELLSPLSTATNKKGDRFSCKVLSPVEYAGAIIGGYVRKSKRSGKAKGKSEMDLAFDSITLADGRAGTFNASVVEVFDVVDAGDQGRADNEGTVKAKSTVKRDMLKIGTGAAIGAIIGGILGGGQGAAIGAAIGAGVGISTTLATKGPDLEFKQGTQFTVVTNAPSRRREAVAMEVSQSKEEKSTVSTTTLTEIQTKIKGTTSSPEVKNTPEPPPTPPKLKLATPRPPSSRVRAYKGGDLFSLNIPANWRESSSANPVTFAPDRGVMIYRGQTMLTHGLMIGTIPSQSQDLRQASEQYINAILQRNAYLQKQSDYQPSTIANHPALSITLAGVSNVIDSTEIVTVYMIMLRNGSLFYVLAVTPKEEHSIYQSAFQTVMSSLQITEQK